MKFTKLIFTLIILPLGCSSNPKFDININGSSANIETLRQYDKAQYENDASNNISKFYRSYDQLLYVYKNIPPPPVIVIQHKPIVIPNNTDIYKPLLDFINNGPQATFVTKNQLLQLTPNILALYQLYLNNLSIQQLVLSPQALLLLSQIQLLYQPLLTQLGLWNNQYLNQWVIYLNNNQNLLLSILQTLYNNILNPPGSTIKNVPPTVITVNVFDTFNELRNLVVSKQWVSIGNSIDSLLYQVIQHAGFTKPLLIIYGSKTKNHSVAIQTSRKNENGNIETHNISENGYYYNSDAKVGPDIFNQGADDISLNYYPIKIIGSTVRTLDVIPSDRFLSLKELSGGNPNYLLTSYYHTYSTLSATLSYGNYYISPGVATTFRSEMGGITGGVRYNDDNKLFNFKLSTTAAVENFNDTSDDNFLWFTDLESIMSTPPATIHSDEHDSYLSCWADATISTSALYSKPINSNKFTIQGDVRLKPMLYAKLDTHILSIQLYGGATFSTIVDGKADINKPWRNISFGFIKSHVGSALSIPINNIINSDLNMSINAKFSSEFSRLWNIYHITTEFDIDQFAMGSILELNNYISNYGIDDIKIGLKLKYSTAKLIIVKSLLTNSYQATINISISI